MVLRVDMVCSLRAPCCPGSGRTAQKKLADPKAASFDCDLPCTIRHRPDGQGLTRADYSKCLTPSCSPCSSARVLLMHSCEKASISRPSTILYSPSGVVVTGKPNTMPAGMPYSPFEGTPLVTHSPFEPRAQSRMWSMAALAAEAADDRPREAMMAAPRLPTVGRKVSAFQTWSLIRSLMDLPFTVAKR